MTRAAAAIATIVGVLLLGMPGGLCFVLMGAGVGHHGAIAGGDRCEGHPHGHHHHHHDHDHDGDGHGQEGDPDGPRGRCCDGGEVLAQVNVLKVDPAAAPAEADFPPDWISPAGRPAESDRSAAGPIPRAGAPPPAATVRLCRFLI